MTVSAFGSANVSVSARSVEVSTMTPTNGGHYALRLNAHVHDARSERGDGYVGVGVSFTGANLGELVTLGNAIRQAIAEVVVAEAGVLDAPLGLTIDAEPVEVPEVLRDHVGDDVALVPVAFADLDRGDFVIDRDGDLSVATGERDAAGDPEVMVLSGYAADRIYAPCDSFVASAWRQVPAHARELA